MARKSNCIRLINEKITLALRKTSKACEVIRIAKIRGSYKYVKQVKQETV